MAWGVWRRGGFAVLAGSAAWRLALGCQLVGGIDEFKPFVGGEASANANEVGKPCVSNDECPAKICIQVVPPDFEEDGGADAEAGATDAGADADVDADAATPKVSVPSPTGNACSTQCTTVADCVSGWTCERDVALDHNICKCTFVPETCDDKDNDCNGLADDTYDKSTDNKNCGKCGNVCGEGTTCVNGHCACAGDPQCDDDKDKGITATCLSGVCRRLQKVADDDQASGPLATDGTTVAWVHTETEEDGSQDPPGTITHPSIVVAPAAGGGTVTTLRKAADCTDGRCQIQSIDQENGTAYWGEMNPGAIVGCKLTGCDGNPQQVASEGGGVVYSIRASGGSLFWYVFNGPSGAQVRVVPEAGGNPTNRNGFGSNNATLAVDGQTIFVFASDQMVKESRAGDPSSRTIASNQGFGPIAVDSSGVYWVVPSSPGVVGEIRACARDQNCNAPGGSPRVVGSALLPPLALADGNLYVGGSNGIVTCPTSGCAAEPPIVAKMTAQSFAIAGGFLYFTTVKGVFRVSR